MTDPDAPTRKKIQWRLWEQLPLLVALVALWMLLWGELSLLSLLSGFLLALAVTRLLYLPSVALSGRVNILWVLVYLLRFAGLVIVSSVVVAGQVFRPGKLPLNAIIQIPLRTRSDLVMSMAAITISLIPGTIVLEIDRERSLLFLHVLAAGDMAGAERARASALSIEKSIIRAIGSRAELEKVRG